MTTKKTIKQPKTRTMAQAFDEWMRVFVEDSAEADEGWDGVTDAESAATIAAHLVRAWLEYDPEDIDALCEMVADELLVAQRIGVCRRAVNMLAQRISSKTRAKLRLVVGGVP